MNEKASLRRDLKRRYAEVERLLNVVLPPCREKSIAMTDLEQSLMWSQKALDRIGDSA